MLLLSMLFLCGQPTMGGSAKAVALGRHQFTMPNGFTIVQVAGAPLVERPISAVLDSRGRLFVTESSGSNEPAATQAVKKPHRVLRLADTDGDGVFDTRTIFADKLMLPQGICLVGNEVWVGAPPEIWRLIDADDDGVAEKRLLWHDGGTLTGCMNDLHGPALGPDGFVYWTKGAFAEQKHTLAGGQPFSTRASQIFRARVDGSARQVVLTGGMDNPVGLAFSSLGDVFLTCTFAHHPGAGLRDALLHAVEGGLWGKDHPPIHEPQHLWTAPDLMPSLAELGPAAPCGLAMARSTRLGLTGQLLSCQFNLRRVQSHTTSPAGSALQATSSDLLVSDHPDFHPTDVLEDADGSILVVDTGGWYKLCCPSSQMVKDQSLGAIYRITRTGVKPLADPRGLEIGQIAGTRWLADPRPMVRDRAVEALVQAGALAELTTFGRERANSVASRVLALWGLCRLGTPEALAELRPFLADPEEALRIVATRALARQRAGGSTERLGQIASQDPSATARRAAVEALVALDPGAGLPTLFAASGATDAPADRAWQHAITRALILAIRANPANANASRQALAAARGNTPTRRFLLTALDQAGQLSQPTEALDLLRGDVADRAFGRWILIRHPEWSPAIARELGEGPAPVWLDADLLAGMLNEPAIQKLLAQWLAGERAALALEAMGRWQGKDIPGVWVEPMLGALKTRGSQSLPTAMVLAKKAPLPEAWLVRLNALAHAADSAPVDRLMALATLPAGRTETDPQFATIVSHLRAKVAAPERLAALAALERVRPSPTQWQKLAETLGEASVADQARLVGLFQAQVGAKDPGAGLALANALQNGKIPATVSTAVLRASLGGYPAGVRDLAEPVLAKRDPSAAAQRALVDKLLVDLPPGDASRGHAVFNSAKTACAACHRIGYKGGLAGPELSAIGRIRTRRDLLESILVPSASFARSYEPVILSLSNGKLVSGVLKSETAAEVRLQTGPEVIEVIPRAQVEEMEPGTVSLMPAGIDKQITPQEMADLIAFLLERK